MKSRAGRKAHGPGPIMLLAGAAFLAACGVAPGGAFGPPSSLAPAGPAAARIANLWWTMTALGSVIWLAVVGLLLYGLFRRRQAVAASEPESAGSSTPVVVGGIVVPAIVLLALFGLTLFTLRAIPTPAEAGDALVVEVIGHQWWWEVNYPQQGVTTANEVHVPVGQPVTIQLASADVIHSFWLPQLHGKFDMIPGQTNAFVIQADQPGTYRGECTEFCGVQHAKMAFVLVAEAPEDFAVWVERQLQPAPEPAPGQASDGLQAFLGSSCVYCHTVRGTNASGRLGPDLTHLASRETLGAGAVPNTRGHLAGWIVDAQSIKPGNKMPPMDLGGDELQALLAYLETLK